MENKLTWFSYDTHSLFSSITYFNVYSNNIVIFRVGFFGLDNTFSWDGNYLFYVLFIIYG